MAEMWVLTGLMNIIYKMAIAQYVDLYAKNCYVDNKSYSRFRHVTY